MIPHRQGRQSKWDDRGLDLSLERLEQDLRDELQAVRLSVVMGRWPGVGGC
jgi:hypothetical protein